MEGDKDEWEEGMGEELKVKCVQRGFGTDSNPTRDAFFETHVVSQCIVHQIAHESLVVLLLLSMLRCILVLLRLLLCNCMGLMRVIVVWYVPSVGVCRLECPDLIVGKNEIGLPITILYVLIINNWANNMYSLKRDLVERDGTLNYSKKMKFKW